MLEIWHAIIGYKAEIIVVLLLIAWGVIIAFEALRRLADGRLSFSECVSLSMAGWVIPVLIVSLLAFILGLFLHADPSLSFFFAALVVTLGFAIWLRNQHRTAPVFASVSLLSILSLALLSLAALRLIFIAKTLLPLYFDSAEHYRIIQILATNYRGTNAGRSLVWPVSFYYHLGYHLIVAILATVFKLNIAGMMLVFGQFILACVPLPLFFIVRRQTKSDLASLLAVGLGVLGWSMPAHVVNWGKYPALLSLLTIQLSIGLMCLLMEQPKTFVRDRILLGILLLSIAVSFIVHSRSIIITGIALVAWRLAQFFIAKPRIRRYLFLGLIAGGLIGEVVVIGHNTLLAPVFEPYLGNGIWITSLVGILAAFAIRKYPVFAFSCLLGIFLLLSGLLFPVPGYSYLTLLDRPLVEMVLFFPFAVLSGLGFAALSEWLPGRIDFLKPAIVIILLGAVAIHAFTSYSFFPSDCCVIAGGDDIVALGWMNAHLSPDALLAISSVELRVVPSDERPAEVGSDAGVWILPLTGRRTLSLPNTTDFSQLAARRAICEQGVDDIYVSSAGQGFDPNSLDRKAKWYRLILFLPKARVYQVIGCTLGSRLILALESDFRKSISR